MADNQRIIYRPSQVRPGTLEELRQYVWQELQHISFSIAAYEHALYGPVHSDVDSTTPIALRDGLYWNGAYFVPDRRTRFIPEGYVQGNAYQRGDEVANGSQISECLVDGATEPPYISATGDEMNFYNGTLTAGGATVKQVIYGIRITAAVAGYINALRVDIATGQRYSLFLVLDPTGTPVVVELGSFTAQITGWFDFNVQQTAVGAGSTIDVVALVTQPDPTPTVYTFNYNYTTPQNAGIPASGVILHSREAPDVMSVNYVDNDGVDRQSVLQGIALGDIIRGHGMQWIVQNVAQQAGHVNFAVSPAFNATGTGVAAFEFETTVPSSVSWGSEAGYWLTNQPPGGGVIKGMQAIDAPYTSIVPDDNAYGMDVFFQQAYVPTQWRVKTSGGGGGGTGEAGPPGPAGPQGPPGADGAIPRPTVKYVSATAYTLVPADENSIIVFTGPSPITVTVPPSSAGIPVGFICHVHQGAASQVTLVGGAGVTLLSSRSLVTSKQNAALSIFNLNVDVYTVVGDQE